MEFSLFNGKFIKDQKPVKSVSLLDLSTLIRGNNDLRQKTEQYRAILDREGKSREVQELKLTFPHFTPCGLFTKKATVGFISKSWTGAVGFDIDRTTNPEIDWDILWGNVITTPEVFLAFRSPSQGIKGLILCDMVFNSETHASTIKHSIYPHFESLWKCNLDPSQSGISQSMFICHDAELHATEPKFAFTPRKLHDVFSYTPLANSADKFILPIFSSLRDCPAGQVFLQTQRNTVLAARLIKGGTWQIDPNEAERILWQSLKEAPGISDHVKAKRDLEFQFRGAMAKSEFEGISPADIQTRDFFKRLERFFREDWWDHSSPYLKVGTKWFRKDPSGKLILWERQSIMDEHKPKRVADRIIEQAPKYLEFVNDPNYLHWQQVVDNKWNLSKPLVHELTEGDWKDIAKVLQHIFGSQYEFALDWLQLAFQKPKQSLPIPCLVSKQQGTGKTTFLEFLKILFEGNTANITINEFAESFNAHWTDKNFLLIDETETDDSLMKLAGPKLKRLATQTKNMFHQKHMTPFEIDFFGKIVICSNDETGFLKITDSDVRFWIVKVPPLKDYDPMIFDKIRSQCGAFLHFLNQREMLHPQKLDRLWFPFEVYRTEFFQEAAEEGKTWLYHDLESLILEDLDERGVNEYVYSRKELGFLLEDVGNSWTLKYLKQVLLKEVGAEKSKCYRIGSVIKRGWLIKKEHFGKEFVTNSNQNHSKQRKNELF